LILYFCYQVVKVQLTLANPIKVNSDVRESGSKFVTWKILYTGEYILQKTRGI
jgi:hypothetical protein